MQSSEGSWRLQQQNARDHSCVRAAAQPTAPPWALEVADIEIARWNFRTLVRDVNLTGAKPGQHRGRQRGSRKDSRASAQVTVSNYTYGFSVRLAVFVNPL